MKKQLWTVLVAIFVLGLFVVTANAQEMDRESLKAEIMKELKEDMKADAGYVGWIRDHITIGGLLRVGASYQKLKYWDARNDLKESDINMTTVELAVGAEINEWVTGDITFLYEDPTRICGRKHHAEDTDVEIDEAIITIGNTDEFPLYFSGGKMYVPFGALLTHFPDDPAMDVPLTLIMGETNEKAALLGVEVEGFGASVYGFNGDIDEVGEDNKIDTYGADAHYALEHEEGLDLLVGVSYISNILDSDNLQDAMKEHGYPQIVDYIAAYDAYLHVGFAGFFFDAEYMRSLDDIKQIDYPTLPLTKSKSEPTVANFEAGYNLDWGRNLEIVLKYVYTKQAGILGFPDDRYGICLNQDIWDHVVVSLAYLYDDYDRTDIDTKDKRNTVYAQLAIEF